MRRKGLQRKAHHLLRQTRRLMVQVEAFQRSAEELIWPLDGLVSEAEGEAMDSPRANVLGALEGLLDQELATARRLLAELAGYLDLEAEFQPRGAGKKDGRALGASS